MAKYTDDEIRNMDKITLKIAGDYLGISASAVGLGMRNDLLPIGFAVHNEDKDRSVWSESWSYNIVPERLIAYNHGTINQIQVDNIEKSLQNIIDEFRQLKSDLVFLLSEDVEQNK